MARDDWRLRIELGDEGAGGLLERLGVLGSEARELAKELEERRLAVSRDSGTVFVYAGSPLELEQARKIIDGELEELRLRPQLVVTEHWLAADDRWSDEPEAPDTDEDLLERGFAPWEVRIPCESHQQARTLARQLEADGFGVVRRWTFVIAGCASRDEADGLAARLHGEVEPGGELVWETARGNPFAIFGGLTDTGAPL